LVISTTSRSKIIVSEKFFTLVKRKKCGYGNFIHRYVSAIYLHAILGVGNFKNVVFMCANRL
jgi:predicted nucleic-acid-binding Zn-ribbon protein